MFKIKYLLLLTISLAACRTVKKTESKRSESIKTDSTGLSVKHTLNTDIASSQVVDFTTYEYEYPEPTAGQKAAGITPQPRIKKKTTGTIKNIQTEKTAEINQADKTQLKKEVVKKATDIQVQKVPGLNWWVLISAAILVGLIILYERYGNLFTLAKKIFFKNEANNN